MSEFRRFCIATVFAFSAFAALKMLGMENEGVTIADRVAASFYIAACIGCIQPRKDAR